MDPTTLLRPRRKITGISAILLPLLENNEVDWDAFRQHVLRTADAGLTPAVNMDTGYVNLIDEATRLQVLDVTRETLGSGPFVAGAFVGDTPGSPLALDAYKARIDEITARGATPVIFQSYGLTDQGDAEIVASYEKIGQACDQFIGFELGQCFLPFGKIYSTDVYRQLMLLPQCIGAKHSSLSRTAEWERLALRDQLRPEFKVFTGNDLAIDMVMYGSDYLLGLSTFAPDLFAQRDAYWAAGDPAFYELNDALQYLGFLTFRQPVPGYKHSAAMFLHLRGWIATNKTYPGSPQRPDSDLPILEDVARQLGISLGKGGNV
ncbi:dihydrodipicolinate synthase family protein [Rosistilla oblonga]|uniref:dihydrodipicolinate synthase family protein n=1 Tax=Rosistilla oblonga TaxID=2527990 RepID=UPI003A96FDE9